MHKENIQIQGVCRARHICRTKSGLHVPMEYALSEETKKFLAEKGITKTPPEIVKSNLVVNVGRAILAKALGGNWETASQSTPYINRITLGTGTKTGNLPQLGDSGLVQELQKLDGTIAGTFLLNDPNDVSPDITFPAAVTRTSGTGATVAIDASEVTTLTDASGDFINDGVQLTDQVTIDNDPVNPLILGIRAVNSATELELHNPGGFTGSSLSYEIGTPGTQMLVSKLMSGNSFLQADYGVAVVIHEAGLLFSNGVLFNRVVFAPSDEDIGILIQSDEANGVEISVRFEWLVTL